MLIIAVVNCFFFYRFFVFFRDKFDEVTYKRISHVVSEIGKILTRTILSDALEAKVFYNFIKVHNKC